MKLLCLIRHAKSERENILLEDFDRPLNLRGYTDSKAMSQRMKMTGFVPDSFLSSTAIRAASTALLFARGLGIGKDQLRFNPSLYEASQSTFLDILHSLPDHQNQVCVFGHNNSLTDVANKLSDTPIQHVPTCGMVLLQSPVMKWKDLSTCKLLWFHYPKSADPQ